MSRATRFLAIVVFQVAIFAAAPELKPRHDPPEQLFRRAPMAESSRSVVINLGTNLHYAFDTELGRVHTIWEGSGLNLWGPPYSYAKAPFICNFEGKILFSFPQVNPWLNENEPLPIRFREIRTTGGEVAFVYDVGATRVIESLRSTEGALNRRFEFPDGVREELEFIAVAETGARAKTDDSELTVVSTNGNMSLRSDSLSWTVTTNEVSYTTVQITEEATETGFKHIQQSGAETRATIVIPASTKPFTLEIALRPERTIKVGKSAPRAAQTYSAGKEVRGNGGDESYKIEYFPVPPEAELMITGMDWLPNGDLAVCTWLGEIYLVQNATGDVRKANYKRFAAGLNEPLGLTVHKGEIFVVQKGELTKVSDSDNDGAADRFECINSAWGYSGNYHSYSFGPLITPQNEFWVFVTGQRGLYELPFQGWALMIGADGENITPFCSGLRVPHGWGFYGPERDIFVTDNQGNWIGACRLNHLLEGKFYGFPSSTPAPKSKRTAEEVEPPVLWFPRALSPSASGFATIEDARFGPFAGQLLVGDFQNSILMRACLEKISGRWQGAVFPFAKGFLSGVNRVKFGPDAKLYVGGGKRTWSTAAPKEYSLDRVVFTGKVPFEVREVHATAQGFELEFTKPLEKTAAADVANYLVKQFTYKYHQDYGSPEFDHNGKVGATETPVKSVELLDSRRVRLAIPGLKTGFVTSFQLALTSEEDDDLRNDSFYYTLNAQP